MHIKINQTQCGSPSLRNTQYCHFHTEAIRRRQAIKVPFLEDTGHIQMVVGEVMRALLEDRIPSRKANSLFYGLQLAQNNLSQNKVSTLRHRMPDGPIIQPLIDELHTIREAELDEENINLGDEATIPEIKAATDESFLKKGIKRSEGKRMQMTSAGS